MVFDLLEKIKFCRFQDAGIIFSAEQIEGWTNREKSRKEFGHLENPPLILSEYIQRKDSHRKIFLAPDSQRDTYRPDITVLLTNQALLSQKVLKLLPSNPDIYKKHEKRVLLFISVKTSST